MDPGPNVELPTVEGILLSRTGREYVVGVPSLLLAAHREPAQLEGRELRIPRERVAFYEVL